MALDRIRHDGFERLIALTPQALLDARQRVEQTGRKSAEPIFAVIDVELAQIAQDIVFVGMLDSVVQTGLQPNPVCVLSRYL